MLVSEYRELFNGFLDNGFFNCGVALAGSRLSNSERLSILNDICYRLQVEYQKHVYLITSDQHTESELTLICPPYDYNDIPKRFDRNDTVFVLDVKLPYFDDNNNWETKIINSLLYYFYPFFGFCSSKQIVKIYENI